MYSISWNVLVLDVYRITEPNGVPFFSFQSAADVIVESLHTIFNPHAMDISLYAIQCISAMKFLLFILLMLSKISKQA